MPQSPKTDEAAATNRLTPQTKGTCVAVSGTTISTIPVDGGSSHGKFSKESQKSFNLPRTNSSDEEKQGKAPVGHSTFEYSADTYTRSKGDDLLVESYDEDDAVYVPFEY